MVENINYNDLGDVDYAPTSGTSNTQSVPSANITNTSSSSSGQILDSISSLNNLNAALYLSQASRPSLYPPLIGILRDVANATNDNKKEQFNKSTAISTKTAEFHRSLGQGLLNVVTYADLVLSNRNAADLYDDIEQQTAAANQAINNYNAGSSAGNVNEDNTRLNQIRDATIALNTAIQNYSNNPSQSNLDAYNMALNNYNTLAQSWNTYILPRNSLARQFNEYINGTEAPPADQDGYNDIVNINNEIIEQANIARAAYGLDPLPYQIGYPYSAPEFSPISTIPGGTPLTSPLIVPPVSNLQPLPQIPDPASLNVLINPLNDLITIYNKPPSRSNGEVTSNFLYRQSLINLQSAATALIAADPGSASYATLLASYNAAVDEYNTQGFAYNQFVARRNVDIQSINTSIDNYNSSNTPTYNQSIDPLQTIAGLPVANLAGLPADWSYNPNAILAIPVPELDSSPELPLVNQSGLAATQLNNAIQVFNNFPPSISDDQTISAAYRQSLIALINAAQDLKDNGYSFGVPITNGPAAVFVQAYNEALTTYNDISEQYNTYIAERNQNIATLNAAITTYNLSNPAPSPAYPLVDSFTAIPNIPYPLVTDLNDFDPDVILSIPVPANTSFEFLPTVPGSSPEIDALNQAINLFNDPPSVNNDLKQIQTVQSAIDAFNLAQITYNSSAQTPQDLAIYNQAVLDYNTAVNTYNAYVTDRNVTINNLINDINMVNSQIEAQNTLIEAYNQLNRDNSNFVQIPTLDTYQLPETLPLAESVPPATFPIDQLDATAFEINTVAPYNVYDERADAVAIDDASSRGSIQFNGTVIAIAGFAGIRKQLEAQVNFYLRNKTANAGNAISFATDLLKQRTAVSGTTLGSSALIGAMAETLDPVVYNNIFNLTIDNASFSAFFSRLNNLEFQNLFANNQLKSSFELLDDAVRIVRNSPIDISSSQALGNFQQALSFENLDNLVSLAKSGISTEAAVANIAAIASGLSLVTNAQGGDQSIANLILSTAGLTDAEIFNINARGIANRDLLNDPFAGSVVADNLAQKIAATTGNLNLEGQIRQAIIESTSQGGLQDENLTIALQNLRVDASLSSTTNLLNDRAFESRVDFRDQVAESLQNRGFSQSEAFNLASQSAGISATAASDAIFSTGDVNADFLSKNLSLLLRSNRPISNPSEIATAVAIAFSENVRQVNEDTARDYLESELQKQGLNGAEAARIASGASFSTEPLKIASRDELVQIIQGTYKPLLGRQQAEQRAQELAAKLVGPANITASDIQAESSQTLTSVIKNDLNFVRTREDQAAFDATIDLFRQNNARTTELVKSQELKLDPGTAIANSLSVRDAPIAPAGGPVRMGGTHQVLDVPV